MGIFMEVRKLNSIVICTTGSDSLAKISLDSYTCEKIEFTLSEKPVGPHGIKVYDAGLVTANCNSNSVSLFDKEQLAEKKNIKIGPKPNDMVIDGNILFTICGESNALVVYDLQDDKVICETTTGSWPHSIDLCRDAGKIFISNLEGNSITVISNDTYEVVKSIPVYEYPTKIKISDDKKYIYVCESYLGSDESGYLEVFSIDKMESIARIKVGTSPIDLFEDKAKIYISNFTDGSISVINKQYFVNDKFIHVGGMPKGIVKCGGKIFVADYLKNKLIILEDEKIKKVIAIESEPNAMTLF